MKVTVDAEGDFADLPAAVEVAAFRIVCETITNGRRHVKATTYAVRLVADDGRALEMVDDGCGLARSFCSGVGMPSIRERAAELGGSCSIEAGAGKGTVVSAHFPVGLP